MLFRGQLYDGWKIADGFRKIGLIGDYHEQF